MTTTPPPPQPPEDPSQQHAAESAVLAEAEDVVEQAERDDPGSLEALDVPRRLLLVHAHPDDETINNGVTMAKYAAEGAAVTLVTCTLGEEGEILVPGLEHLAADRDDALGEHRIGELAAAMEALGVTGHRFLGGPGRYRDSGMMGLATNDRPGCFWQADLDEAAGLLVDIIREVRPQVLVTYDENGGYGHPDHIQAHRVAMRGAELAADPDFGAGEPWQIAKTYWNAMPESRIREGIRALRAAGESTGFAEMDPDQDIPFAVPDELVTACIDGLDHVDAKLAAMRAHATQISVEGPFFALSNNLGHEVWAQEFYRLVRGAAGDVDPETGTENDLFAGVD
jgi:N-acetyl-1-D-myo-inositol-2-amino-2-deoxy-alpha-D-glucopyranoside deacetylase